MKSLRSNGLASLVATGLALAAPTGTRGDQTDNNGIAYKYIDAVFPDAELVPCGMVPSQSVEECLHNKLLIGYMTWSLKNAVLGGELTDFLPWLQNHEFDDFPAYIEFQTKKAGRENVLSQDRTPEGQRRRVYADRMEFYQDESRQMSACLRSSCGEVIRFSNHGNQEWADIWDAAMRYNLCVVTRDRTYKPSTFSFYDGLVYEEAKVEAFPQCPPDGVPNEVFEMGNSLRPPPGRF